MTPKKTRTPITVRRAATARAIYSYPAARSARRVGLHEGRLWSLSLHFGFACLTHREGEAVHLLHDDLVSDLD